MTKLDSPLGTKGHEVRLRYFITVYGAAGHNLVLLDSSMRRKRVVFKVCFYKPSLKFMSASHFLLFWQSQLILRESSAVVKIFSKRHISITSHL